MYNINTTFVYSFIAWVTVLTPSYTNNIIAGMVKKGYAVSATSAKGDVVLAKDTNASAIISLKIVTTAENASSSSIYQDLMAVLNEMKAYFYSVVITPYVDCAWCGSNILINKPTAVAADISKPDKSNLN